MTKKRLLLHVLMVHMHIEFLSATYDRCLNNLSKVLQRCEYVNLVLNWEKCHLMVQEGVVLGHVISNKGIEVDKAKVEVIKKFL